MSEEEIFEGLQVLGVQLARLYDVQMTLLTLSNPTAAARLAQLHYEGKLMTSEPTFDGTFVTDQVNSTNSVDNTSTE